MCFFSTLLLCSLHGLAVNKDEHNPSLFSFPNVPKSMFAQSTLLFLSFALVWLIGIAGQYPFPFISLCAVTFGRKRTLSAGYRGVSAMHQRCISDAPVRWVPLHRCNSCGVWLCVRCHWAEEETGGNNGWGAPGAFFFFGGGGETKLARWPAHPPPPSHFWIDTNRQ